MIQFAITVCGNSSRGFNADPAPPCPSQHFNAKENPKSRPIIASGRSFFRRTDSSANFSDFKEVTIFPTGFCRDAETDNLCNKILQFWNGCELGRGNHGHCENCDPIFVTLSCQDCRNFGECCCQMWEAPTHSLQSKISLTWQKESGEKTVTKKATKALGGYARFSLEIPLILTELPLCRFRHPL